MFTYLFKLASYLSYRFDYGEYSSESEICTSIFFVGLHTECKCMQVSRKYFNQDLNIKEYVESKCSLKVVHSEQCQENLSEISKSEFKDNLTILLIK